MARRTLRSSAADLPLARWLVAYGEAKGYGSGRQMALYLQINPAVFGTWLRGEYEPDGVNQERLAEATGEPLEKIAALVRETRLLKRGPAPERAGTDRTNQQQDAERSAIRNPEAAAARPRVEAAMALLTGDATDDVLRYIEDWTSRVRASKAAREGRDGPSAGDPGGAAP